MLPWMTSCPSPGHVGTFPLLQTPSSTWNPVTWPLLTGLCALSQWCDFNFKDVSGKGHLGGNLRPISSSNFFWGSRNDWCHEVRNRMTHITSAGIFARPQKRPILWEGTNAVRLIMLFWSTYDAVSYRKKNLSVDVLGSFTLTYKFEWHAILAFCW